MQSRATWLWLGAALVVAIAVFFVRNRRNADYGNDGSTGATSGTTTPGVTKAIGPLKTLGPDGVFAPPRTTLRDKPTRDDLRERIYRAFGEPLPGSTNAKPSATEGQVLDKAYVGTRLSEDFIPLARECYETALLSKPDLRGAISFDFVIVGDESVGGVVESAELAPESTIREPELVTCMRESLLSLSFAPPPNDGKVTVRFPVTLSPDDEPDSG